jgi:hypothetical protein
VITSWSGASGSRALAEHRVIDQALLAADIAAV